MQLPTFKCSFATFCVSGSGQLLNLTKVSLLIHTTLKGVPILHWITPGSVINWESELMQAQHSACQSTGSIHVVYYDDHYKAIRNY